MKTIVVWFSCGAASAVAAKKTIEKYGKTHLIRVVNNPIAEEDEDNRRFLKDVEDWLGVKIESAINPVFPNASCVEVWDKRKFMSGPDGAPCTTELKKRARQIWENNNPHDFIVLGFTAEEVGRYDHFKKEERSNILPILIEDGITKKDCFEILLSAGLKLPRIYEMGYPNANCIGCVKATSSTYWNHVRKVHVKIFDERLEQSRKIGAKLVRCHPKYLSFCAKRDDGKWYDERTGKCLHKLNKSTGKWKLEPPRIYLDELPENAKGASLKNLDFECGIFCATAEDSQKKARAAIKTITEMGD